MNRRAYQMHRPMNGDRCVAGAALQPLKREQKTALVLLAKDAFQQLTPDVDFDTWRQSECLRAVGRQISQARNEDFLPLKAHFQNLMGRAGAAFQTHMHAEGDPRRQAMHALERQCAEVKKLMPGALGYAAGFLRRKGTTLDDASPKQLWSALFTLRRKVQSLRHDARGTKAKRQPRAPRVPKSNRPF